MSTAPTHPLRLRLAAHPGRDHLDGGWWPHTRDLATELSRLVDGLPTDLAPVVGALHSPADWDHAPTGPLRVAAGHVDVDRFPGADPALVQLTLADDTVWRLLVVPPDFSPDQGEEALLAAATSGNRHDAADLLDTVEGGYESRVEDHWLPDGG